MRFDFEIGDEGVEHLLVLPVHLHVVEFAIDSDGVEEGLQSQLIEEEDIATEATSVVNYSTH